MAVLLAAAAAQELLHTPTSLWLGHHSLACMWACFCMQGLHAIHQQGVILGMLNSDQVLLQEGTKVWRRATSAESSQQ
jgi:hypothetical protein